MAEAINELNQIADNMENRVIHGVGRGVGVAEAAEVGRDGSVPQRGEAVHLVTPGVPQLREAVEEEDNRPVALFRNVHVDAVHEDGAMRDAFAESAAVRCGGGRGGEGATAAVEAGAEAASEAQHRGELAAGTKCAIDLSRTIPWHRAVGWWNLYWSGCEARNEEDGKEAPGARRDGKR